MENVDLKTLRKPVFPQIRKHQQQNYIAGIQSSYYNTHTED